MPRYIEVVAAVSETATKILALRSGKRRAWIVDVTTRGGETASISWSDHHKTATLNMPSLPPDAILTRAEADRLVAFIAHECCHVLHSDMPAWNRAVAAGSRVRNWTNALEDVRIEHAEIRAGHFPALQGLLAGMASKLHYEAVTESAKHGRVIGKAVADAPYVACIMGRLANGYPMPAAMGLSGDMSPDVARLLDIALAGVRKCTSTDDVVALAQQLAGLEQSLPPVAPPPNQKGQNGQGEPGEPQDGQRTETDLSGMVKGIAERAGYDLVYGDASPQLSVVQSDVVDRTAATGTTGEQTAAAQVLAGRLPRSSVLAGQVGRLLVSAEVHRVTHRESSGRLDRRALVRMKVGATDVYSRRDDTPGIDTALMILIDGSSSMRGWIARPEPGQPAPPTRMDVAQTAAWHIACAAESANAKVMIAGFYTRRRPDGNPIGGARIEVVKPWHAPTAHHAAGLTQIQPQGATPLSPAIIKAAGMLAEVNATRHILMVLTDGECDMGPGAVTRACSLADSMGVETVGIGMACASVTAAFPPRYSVNVVDLAQLAQKGLGALVAMLEDANPRGAD